jgi:polysaccharide deacetylase 2 family uncharacterized protein YibQ/copper chaperone CopZ
MVRQDGDQPPSEKTAALEQQSAEKKGQPWYQTQAPPPAMITAPDAPIFPDPLDETSGQPLRPYEEALPVEIYETPPETKPPPKAKAAPIPPAAVEKPPLRTQTAVAQLPPWRRFALATPEARGRPRIAIVIDDMGIDKKRSASVIALPAPLTLSFLTYATGLKRQTRAARAAGHELLLHIPMEPRGKNVDPGSNVLLGALPAKELRRRLAWGFDRFGSYVGVNNHMGSKFTADRAAMTVVMEEVKRRGLLFLDSRTVSGTVGSALARRMGVPFADRNVFLDNQNDPASVRALGRGGGLGATQGCRDCHRPPPCRHLKGLGPVAGGGQTAGLSIGSAQCHRQGWEGVGLISLDLLAPGRNEMDNDGSNGTMEDKMSTTYQVSGMTCDGCANAVTRAIKAVAPAAAVEVDLASKSITVEGFDNTTAIATAVDDAGFEFGGVKA